MLQPNCSKARTLWTHTHTQHNTNNNTFNSATKNTAVVDFTQTKYWHLNIREQEKHKEIHTRWWSVKQILLIQKFLKQEGHCVYSSLCKHLSACKHNICRRITHYWANLFAHAILWIQFLIRPYHGYYLLTNWQWFTALAKPFSNMSRAKMYQCTDV
jgi:hypothetical protein